MQTRVAARRALSIVEEVAETEAIASSAANRCHIPFNPEMIIT
jgi:hypothetical protein